MNHNDRSTEYCFRFSAAPILSLPFVGDFVSKKTRTCIVNSSWVSSCSPASDHPDVYVCEAFGGASGDELLTLFTEVGRLGSSVILIWTADYPFPETSQANLLLFQVSNPPPLSCGYLWDTGQFASGWRGRWTSFDDRPILASFVGSRSTHPVREVVFSPEIAMRSDVVVQNIDWWSSFSDDHGHQKRTVWRCDYRNILSQSKYALCPRGNGPSSVRRWEAMYSGAIPILLDDFTMPFGLELPIISFYTNQKRSTEQNATNLLHLIFNHILYGARLQYRLQQCIITNFDDTVISNNHSFVKQIVRIANQNWLVGHGFAKGAHSWPLN